MNLDKLFEVQRGLDAEIEKNHPTLPGEDRLSKRILALQVELGECANEWRGFKFWSTNQEPRTAVYGSEFTPGTHGPNTTLKNLLLEEYVDCLHFILSIGLEIGISNFEFSGKSPKPRSVTYKFSMCYSSVANFENVYYLRGKENAEFKYGVMLNEFIGLGAMLGFDWEQIETAYLKKNEINYQRQDTGY